MMRFAASIACLSAAISCFTNNNLELGLPHWAWIIAGIGWIAAGIGWINFTLHIAIRGTEK